MGILSFSNFRAEKSKASGGDWSQQEVADFYRAHGLLVQNGISIGIDRGLSDENEPWMVFYDDTSQDVFLHVARINHHCFLICDPLNLRLDAPDIKSLIERFETSVRKYLEINAENSKNVLIHPAARIIMSISAVFLLFKLENSEAKAYGAPNKVGEGEANQASLRNLDKSSTMIARVQSATARIFEQVDSPVNIAVLASVVLLGEIAQAHSETQKQEATSQDNLDVQQMLAAPLAAAKQAHADNGALVDHKGQADFEIVESQNNASLAVSALPVKGGTIAFDAIQQKTVEAVAINTTAFHLQLPDSQSSILENEASALLLPADEKEKAKSEDQVYDEAVALIKKIFSQTETDADTSIEQDQKIIEVISNILAEDVLQDIEDLPKDLIGEISATVLDQIKDHAGFVTETTYEGKKLYDLLKYFADQMGSYQIGFDGKKILVEDNKAEQLVDADIGLWTNKMADGVTISVVGRADLIDDVLTFYN